MVGSGSRAATLRLIGGRSCLDLVNTVSWRGDPARTQDHLATTADCLTWCQRAGVLSADEVATLEGSPPAAAGELLDALRRTRDTIAAHLVDPPVPDLEPLAALIRDTLAHSRLVDHDGVARWEPPLDARAPARRITLDLHDLLTHPPGPIGVCADPACRWAFLDTSRQHTRRWCRSADCGNRHRARRHYQQTRPPRVPPASSTDRSVS